jgi:GAF domain-containing protein
MAGLLTRFHEADESFSVVRKSKIDLSALLLMEDDYIPTPELYKLVNRCIHMFLHHRDVNQAMQHILEIVGNHMDVSRIYLFQRDEGNIFTNTHEWCAKGVEPQKNFLTRVLIPESWVAALSKDGMILSSDIADLPEDSHAELARQGIKSVLVIPLWDGGEISGFAGFDDCANYRNWRPEEVFMLHNLCLSIAVVMNMLRMQRELDKLKGSSGTCSKLPTT